MQGKTLLSLRRRFGHDERYVEHGVSIGVQHDEICCAYCLGVHDDNFVVASDVRIDNISVAGNYVRDGFIEATKRGRTWVNLEALFMAVSLLGLWASGDAGSHVPDDRLALTPLQRHHHAKHETYAELH